jgi:hypothetical protein
MKKSTRSLLTLVALFGVATGCASTARIAEGKGGSKGGTATRSAQVSSGEGGTAQLSAPVGAGPLCTKATKTATFRANCVCHYKPAGSPIESLTIHFSQKPTDASSVIGKCVAAVTNPVDGECNALPSGCPGGGVVAKGTFYYRIRNWSEDPQSTYKFLHLGVDFTREPPTH